MASTYVNDLRLEEMATGDQSGTWGTTTNTNLELIAEAFSYGTEGITTNADTHSTVIADGATDPGRSMFLKYTGTLDSTCTITISPNTVSKLWIIENATSGSQSIIIKQGTGGTVTIPSGKTKVIYSDGAGSGGAMVDAFASLNLETSGIIETSSSIQTPLIEFTDGDDAITIADGGATTFAQTATFNDDIIIGDGKTIGSASDVDAMTIAANGQVTFSQTLIGTALDISGDIDVDGTTNLDVVDIDGAVDMASTLAVGGVLTADAGVAIDNITIDGTEIDLSSGNLTVDSAGQILLNADDDGKVFLADDSVTYGLFENSSSDFVIESRVQDKDILFKGNDGGSTITALQLDMSNGGSATFLDDIDFGGKITQTGTGNNKLVGKLGIGTTASEMLTISASSGDTRILLGATAGNDTEIKFFNNGNAAYTIGHDDATDNFVIGGANVDTPLVTVDSTGHLSVKQGNKFLFDGPSGHTYIEEESDSNLKFYVAGGEQLNIQNNVATFATSLVDLPSNGKIRFGAGDAHIQEGQFGNYSLDFSTYNGSSMTTALILHGDNAAHFKGLISGSGNVNANNYYFTDGATGMELASNAIDLVNSDGNKFLSMNNTSMTFDADGIEL